MKILAVIPARYGSSRLPGKPLLPVGGVPLVRRVAQRVLAAAVADHVIVATDDARISAAVEGLPLEVVLSDRPFRCGSDRVAAAVGQRSPSVVINVQGDEAMVDAGVLAGAVEALARRDIGTVATQRSERGWLDNPHVVKVRVGVDGQAVDFARGTPGGRGGTLLQHLGVYAFSARSLPRFAALSASSRETREGLEQLRALQREWKIGVTTVDAQACAINTARDLITTEKVLMRLSAV